MDCSDCFFLGNKNEQSNEDTTEINYSMKSENWHEDFMQYADLHSKTEGKSQIIALIDSGISEFQENKVDKNYNMISSEDVYDENGHGTMMCSLIIGGEGLQGISPQTKIYSYKVVDKSGKVTPEILADAIDKAVKDNVTIINISLGSYFDNKRIKESVKGAIESGIIVVASSGDYETEDMLYPAKYNNCISVGAIDENIHVWKKTNAKDQCDILAPGVDINTILNTGELEKTNGTSQSTALISGYIALIKDYARMCDIDIKTSQIKKILIDINNKKISYLEGLNRIEEYTN